MTVSRRCTQPGCAHVVKGSDRTHAVRGLSTHLARHHRIGEDPKECRHEHPHRHGTIACYNRDRCRCLPCWDARNARQNTMRRLKAFGRWESGLVPAAPVRTHVAMLRQAGLGVDTIVARAGVPHMVLKHLLYGSPCRGVIPSRQVRADHAEAILGVPVDARLAFRQSPVGTVRRLRALIALGHTCRSLSAESGVAAVTIGRLVSETRCPMFVEPGTAEAVASAYERLWNVRPEGTAAVRNRKSAEAKGWATPLMWDDIDDPESVPSGARPTRKRVAPDVVLEDLEWLIRTGVNPQQAVARLGMSLSSVEQAMRRLGRNDLARWIARKDAA